MFNCLYYLVALMSGISVHGAQRRTGEVVYKLNFLSDIEDCENFRNEYWDLTRMRLVEQSATTAFLTGELPVFKDIDEKTSILVSVYKKDEVTDEYNFLYNVEGELCSHINDENAPWTVLFKAMEVLSCPIKAKTYPIEQLQLNLDYAESAMKREFVGSYISKLSFVSPGNGMNLVPAMISCHQMNLSVIEVIV